MVSPIPVSVLDKRGCVTVCLRTLILALLLDGHDAVAEPNFILPGGETEYESGDTIPYPIDWPTLDWERGGNNSTYAEWDTFGWQGEDDTFEVLPPDVPPDVGFSGFSTPSLAVVNELTGAGWYTSSANVYSFSEAIAFTVTLPAPESSGDALYMVAQFNTFGPTVDPSSVLLSFDAGQQRLEASGSLETQRVDVSGGGVDTFEISTLYWWELPQTSLTLFELEFAAAAASMSLTNLVLDAYSATSETPVGDYDQSGTVDSGDYTVWRSQYGLQVEPYAGADGNGDGWVDAADYALWRNALPSESPVASATVAIPEPSALGWIGLFGLAFMFCWSSHWSIAPRD